MLRGSHLVREILDVGYTHARLEAGYVPVCLLSLKAEDRRFDPTPDHWLRNGADRSLIR